MGGEGGGTIALFVVVRLCPLTRPGAQEVARAGAPSDGEPGGARRDEPEARAPGDHLGAAGVPAVGDPGRGEHDRVQDGRREHERDSRAGVDAPRDQAARDRDRAALADREGDPAQGGAGDLQGEREPRQGVERAFRQEHGDRGGGERADEDERQRLDHDRGEDEQERLRCGAVAEPQR